MTAVPANVAVATFGARPFNPNETLAQIGVGNVLAVCGGRVEVWISAEGDPVGLLLPAGQGYAVLVTLAWDDTYIVRRLFRRNGWIVKGEETDIYAEDVAASVYAAGMYVNVEFPR